MMPSGMNMQLCAAIKPTGLFAAMMLPVSSAVWVICACWQRFKLIVIAVCAAPDGIVPPPSTLAVGVNVTIVLSAAAMMLSEGGPERCGPGLTAAGAGARAGGGGGGGAPGAAAGPPP